MTDVLIRHIPDSVVSSIDLAAREMRLSRSEYLRRQIVGQFSVVPQTVTLADLKRASDAASDLLNDEVMAAAWR